MKYLKCIISVLLMLLWLIPTQAQDRPTLYLGGHLNTLDGNTNAAEYLKSSVGLHLGYFNPIWSTEDYNFGVSLLGQYSSISNNFQYLEDLFRISSLDNSNSITNSNAVNQSLVQFGVGPQFNYEVGQNFWISPLIEGGYFSFNQDALVLTQEMTFETAAQPQVLEKEVLRQDGVRESGFFLRPALRLSYQIAQNWSVWGEANYLIANTNTTQNRLVPLGEPYEGGEYFIDQIMPSEEYITTENETSLNNLGMSLGLAFKLGEPAKNNVVNTISIYESERVGGESALNKVLNNTNDGDDNDNNKVQKAQDFNSSRSTKSGSPVFANMLKE